MNVGDRFPDGLLDRSVEIGAVTDRSVRIWVRQPGSLEVSGTLAVAGGASVEASTRLSPESDWTGAIQFELPEPAPDARFSFSVAGQQRSGRLAPASGRPAPLTFAFGSCNRPFQIEDGEVVYHQAAGVYGSLIEDLRRASVGFVLLTGDQIYSDDLDPISVRAIQGSDESRLPALDQTVDIYRLITRGYLGVQGFQRIREEYPTLCIWDDHDIFNNWGSTIDESPLDRRMFEAASQVYVEYQHARNPGTPTKTPPFHYWFRWGDAGFIVLDIRGKRDWTAGQLLGEEQWDAVMDLLASPELDEVSTLFVVTSIPVAHVGRWLVTLFEHLPGTFGDTVRDRWSTGPFRPQRDALLEHLLEWQARAEHRQVIVLSGDVHVAGAFTIRPRSGRGVIQQFTSSALTTPLTSYERYFNLFAARGNNLFEPKWRFERQFISYANNAGLVRLTPRDQGGHHVEFLVRGWSYRLNKLRTVARFASQPER